MTQKLTAIFGIAVLAAILLGGLTFSQSALAGGAGGGPPGKVTICHFPPGDPSDFETLSVSINALPAHLAHGDTIGACDISQTCQEGCDAEFDACLEECDSNGDGVPNGFCEENCEFFHQECSASCETPG